MNTQRTYIAIDLKSFYASVECMQRNLDPMTTNLVVADLSRTEKTICLAVTPSLKQYGISGRARLFEVVQQVKQANTLRQRKAPGRTFTGASHDDTELKAHPELDVVQLQFNYVDYDDPKVQSWDCYQVCEKYGKPVIVMEPLKGGNLMDLPD